MVKRRILIVDHDDQTLHTLAHALRRADFLVTCNPDPHAALSGASQAPPDALVVATTLPYLDGFEFVRRLKNLPACEHLPIIFVTGQSSVEERATTLALDAADYVAKPLVPADVVARLRAILKRPVPQALQPDQANEFTGDLRDLDVAALCNMMQSGKKSGTLVLRRSLAHGFVYFTAGQVIDAEVAQLHGLQAVYQLLRWQEGAFCLSFGVPDRLVALTVPTHALLLEGMHRFDKWTRWLTKLPPLDSVLHLQPSAVQSVGIDATTDPVLNLIDGQRAMMHIFEASSLGDVETAEAIAQHLADGHVAHAPTIHAPPPPASPSSVIKPWSASNHALLPGAAAPPRPTLYYGGSTSCEPDTSHPEDAPRSPEEAFGLAPAPRVDQRYLDAPLPAAPAWRRPLFWLWATSVGTLIGGALWNLAQR